MSTQTPINMGIPHQPSIQQQNQQNLQHQQQQNQQSQQNQQNQPPQQGVTVFQCKKCSKIISDTLSWGGAIDEENLKIFIVSSIVPDSIRPVKTLTVASDNGIDRGSSFNDLICAHCDEVIGRIYVTTTQNLDFARGMYAFLADKMAFYMCGSHQQLEPEIDEAIKALIRPDPSTTSKQLAMIESMVMAMYKKIEGLEERIKQLEK